MDGSVWNLTESLQLVLTDLDLRYQSFENNLALIFSWLFNFWPYLRVQLSFPMQIQKSLSFPLYNKTQYNILERFSLEYWKPKSKWPLTNHSVCKQFNGPISTESVCMQAAPSAGKRVRGSHDLFWTSDWSTLNWKPLYSDTRVAFFPYNCASSIFSCRLFSNLCRVFSKIGILQLYAIGFTTEFPICRTFAIITTSLETHLRQKSLTVYKFTAGSQEANDNAITMNKVFESFMFRSMFRQILEMNVLNESE